jgi:hypothetical protein
MTRDDLRPHGHTKTGDGGDIDGIDVDSDGEPYISGTDDDGNSTLDPAAGGSGGTTATGNGTVTIAANGTATVNTGITTEAGIYLARVGVANSGSGLADAIVEDRTLSPTDDTGQVAFYLAWNGSEYVIEIDSGIGSQTDIDWGVIEL